MAANRTLKGISDRTRAAINRAAEAEGLGVSEWMERALAQAVDAALNPKVQGVSREELAEIVRGVLREELAAVVEQIERLAGSRVEGEGGAVSPVAAVRARMRRRRGV